MSLIFYYGADSFRVREAMEKKIAVFLAKNKNGIVEKLDFEKENCQEEVGHVLKRRSFFDEPRLVITYACLPAKDLQKKNELLFKFLNKEAEKIKELGSIKGSALEKWALEKIIQAGFKIKLSVLKKLTSFGLSQAELNQEIEKILAYESFHSRQEIESKTVDQFIKSEQLINNFALIDAIGARDIKKAVICLNQTLTGGTESQAVLGQIIYQFRNLLKVKSYTAAVYLHGSRVTSESLAKLNGLHPFF